MKQILVILFSLLTVVVYSQSKKDLQAMGNSRTLMTAVFGTKDSITVDKLFASSMTYGHSSGKIQTRAEAIHGIITNKSVYTELPGAEGYNVNHVGDSIIVTHIFRATEKKEDGTVSPLNISIAMVWFNEKGKLKLFRRQATKVN
jgi:hypothetical protein